MKNNLYLMIALEQFKAESLADGELLEDIVDEIEGITKNKIEEWFQDDKIKIDFLQ